MAPGLVPAGKALVNEVVVARRTEAGKMSAVDDGDGQTAQCLNVST